MHFIEHPWSKLMAKRATCISELFSDHKLCERLTVTLVGVLLRIMVDNLLQKACSYRIAVY